MTHNTTSFIGSFHNKIKFAMFVCEPIVQYISLIVPKLYSTIYRK